MLFRSISGVKQQNISRYINRKVNSISDDNWEKLFPLIREYIPPFMKDKSKVQPSGVPPEDGYPDDIGNCHKLIVHLLNENKEIGILKKKNRILMLKLDREAMLRKNRERQKALARINLKIKKLQEDLCTHKR